MQLKENTLLAGRYRIESHLGSGGMSEVYKVWDTIRSVSLACKVLRDDLADDVVFLRRFKREAQTLAKLQHPNIVRFYGLEEDKDLVFFLQDFIDGVTLKREIKRKVSPFSYQEVMEIITPICSALNYANHLGVVHCDIKPANIMIDKQGKVYLTDFGISRVTDSSTTATMIGAGTPAYMAPEQILGKGTFFQTDIYGIGTVIYEMFTGGERPFTGERSTLNGTTAEKVRWEKLHLAPPSPRQFNDTLRIEMENIILRCLEKDYRRRYANSLELLGALNNLATEEKENHDILIKKTTEEILQREIRTKGMPLNKKQTISILLGTAGLIILVFFIIRVNGLIKYGPILPSTQIQSENPPTEPSNLLNVTESQKTTLQTIGLGTLTNTTIPSREIPTKIATPTIPTPTPGIGSTKESQIDGMIMVYVPEGFFIMGSTESNDELPIRKVYLSSYWIDQTEVTNAMFEKFINEKEYVTDAEKEGLSLSFTGNQWKNVIGANWRHPKGPESNIDDLSNHPVVHISWNDAHAYCEWAGKSLPTEAQWEKAARGTEGQKYPWGNNDPANSLLNFADSNIRTDTSNNSINDGYQFTSPVGNYPKGKSPYLVYDMAGNVWEWVADWHGDYPENELTNPEGPPTGYYHVLRGGSWGYNDFNARSASRPNFDGPTVTSEDYGFRCVSKAD